MGKRLEFYLTDKNFEHVGFTDLKTGDIIMSRYCVNSDYYVAMAEVLKIESDNVHCRAITDFLPIDNLSWARIGSSTDPNRRSFLVLKGEGTDAPVIQLYSDISSADDFGTPKSFKSAFGKLDGYATSSFGRLKGYGLYSSNCYLEGDFILRNGKSVAQIADGDITLSAERTTVKDATGNNIAIFKGAEGGVVEMQNIRVFGSVATPFKSVTPSVSGSYVLNMNDTYNFTLEATNSTIRTLRLPRGERYNGVTVSIFTNWNAPGIILITSEAPIMGFVSTVTRIGDTLSESSVGTLRGYQINMSSGRYIELKCVGTGNGNTGWVMTTYTDINL